MCGWQDKVIADKDRCEGEIRGRKGPRIRVINLSMRVNRVTRMRGRCV